MSSSVNKSHGLIEVNLDIEKRKTRIDHTVQVKSSIKIRLKTVCILMFLGICYEQC